MPPASEKCQNDSTSVSGTLSPGQVTCGVMWPDRLERGRIILQRKWNEYLVHQVFLVRTIWLSKGASCQTFHTETTGFHLGSVWLHKSMFLKAWCYRALKEMISGALIKTLNEKCIFISHHFSHSTLPTWIPWEWYVLLIKVCSIFPSLILCSTWLISRGYCYFMNKWLF